MIPTDGRWHDRDYAGRIIVGSDETSHNCEPTAEQAERYVAGELDYCDGCMSLQPTFEGEFCPECEVLP
jgi:hypothetical protein